MHESESARRDEADALGPEAAALPLDDEAGRQLYIALEAHVRGTTGRDELLGPAVRRFASAARDTSLPAESVLVALKAIFKRACFAAPAIEKQFEQRLFEQMVVRCIQEYFSETK